MDYTQLDDRELARQAPQLGERAFRELLRRYERPVFSLVFRILRNREEAEEAAQDAFIKAFGAVDRYDPSYRFSSWIFKIANNVAIDRLRRRELDTIPLDGSAHAASPEESERTRIVPPDPGEAPDEYVENRELGGRIDQALGRLRPEYRSAIVLRHVEGRSYEEVGEIMGIPQGTAKTYVHRARAELQGLLVEVGA
ncbi:MAG: sigma-70 family RNA polymerase sigma factor [Gemmatimonadota bacterium]